MPFGRSNCTNPTGNLSGIDNFAMPTDINSNDRFVAIRIQSRQYGTSQLLIGMVEVTKVLALFAQHQCVWFGLVIAEYAHYIVENVYMLVPNREVAMCIDQALAFKLKQSKVPILFVLLF